MLFSTLASTAFWTTLTGATIVVRDNEDSWDVWNLLHSHSGVSFKKDAIRSHSLITASLSSRRPPPTHSPVSNTLQSTLEAQVQSINLSPSIPESDQSTSSDIPSPDEIWETLTEAVSSRGSHPPTLFVESGLNVDSAGPDYKGSLHRTVDSGSGDVELRFHAAILHMRGRQVTKQPFVAENGDIFLWNGEIFDGLDVRLSSSRSFLANE